MCECDKCGHQWKSFGTPKQCTSSSCRTLLWNEDSLDSIIEALEEIKEEPRKKSAEVSTRIRMLDRSFDEIEMVQTEVWLMSDKSRRKFRRSENNILIDVGSAS